MRNLSKLTYLILFWKLKTLDKLTISKDNEFQIGTTHVTRITLQLSLKRYSSQLGN